MDETNQSKKFKMDPDGTEIVSEDTTQFPTQEIAAPQNTNKGDYDKIMSNVDDVKINGVPGFLCIYGSNAIPLLAGKSGEPNTYHPIGAASYLGNGKIIGFTHDNFMIPESSPTCASDKNQLILNCVNWTSSSSPMSSSKEKFNQLNPIQVLVVRNQKDTLVDFLMSHDISTSQIPLAQLNNLNDIEKYNVVVVKEFFDELEFPLLKEYVENGGGLVISLTSWAHHYFLDIEGHFGTNFPPNQISASAGFIWRNEDEHE